MTHIFRCMDSGAKKRPRGNSETENSPFGHSVHRQINDSGLATFCRLDSVVEVTDARSAVSKGSQPPVEELARATAWFRRDRYWEIIAYSIAAHDEARTTFDDSTIRRLKGCNMVIGEQ